MNKKNRKSIVYMSGLLAIGLLFISCKREKKEFIGPEIAIASNNFKVITPFSIDNAAVNFTVDSNWFHAGFNERVSWIITVKGLTSKAEKIIKGTSDEISLHNSTWRGGHSGLNFFQAGEQIVSELSVFGKLEVWTDTSTVAAVKTNFGTDVILWWDMDLLGVAKHNTVYWFDFYDGDGAPPTVGVGERLLGKFEITPQIEAQPVQGIYRSLEGIELSVPVNYYIGGCSHSYTSTPYGFAASTDEVYLNFYARKRTVTSSIGVTLTSVLGTDTSALSYDTQTITWEGWKLVSIRLSDMTPDTRHTAPFAPANIRQFGANLQTYTNTNVKTGFDIDFITFTKGGPFNPDRY